MGETGEWDARERKEKHEKEKSGDRKVEIRERMKIRTNGIRRKGKVEGSRALSSILSRLSSLIIKHRIDWHAPTLFLSNLLYRSLTLTFTQAKVNLTKSKEGETEAIVLSSHATISPPPSHLPLLL